MGSLPLTLSSWGRGLRSIRGPTSSDKEIPPTPESPTVTSYVLCCHLAYHPMAYHTTAP